MEVEKLENKNKYEDYYKQYREDHKDYYKQYFEEHKEEYRQKESCSLCGGTYQMWNKGHHKDSKRHKIKLQDIENEKLKRDYEELKNKIKNLV